MQARIQETVAQSQTTPENKLGTVPKGNSARSFFRRKRFWIATLVSVGVLALLAWKAQIRLGTIGNQLNDARWGILGGTLVFSVLFHVFVGADKWWRILRALGANVSYWEVFRVRLGSDPIRFAAPFKAGELVNALHFGKLESLGFSRAAGSVLFDKSLNLFGTVFWLYVGFAALAKAPMLWELVVHLLVGASVLVLIYSRRFRWAIVAVAGRLHPKLGRFGAGVLSAFEEFSPVQKAGFLTYGILFQLRPLAVCALMLLAFQTDWTQLPSSRQFLAYGSVVVLTSNIPSMGGIGPREAAVVEMFQGFADPAMLLTVGLAMSFGVQVLPAIVGIPWMFPLLRSLAEFELPQGEEKQGEVQGGEVQRGEVQRGEVQRGEEKEREEKEREEQRSKEASPIRLGTGGLSHDAEVKSDA